MTTTWILAGIMVLIVGAFGIYLTRKGAHDKN
jgi:hypothetical protein